ncbi:alkane 1-monooxygenase [Phenylobacterium sp.]|jgi:alkane 1-monooxygenase|uniref:alkane 1-monooxygenase n=1 Tax=Phenylobacterium sp. TaxID=1871053 RepID=UPI002F402465
MAALRYCLPFAFLALVPIGATLGGAWAFAAAVATPLGLAGLDAALGEGPADRGPRWLRLLPRLYIPAQLATIAWGAAVVSQPGACAVTVAGLVVSSGVTAGVFGFVAAHEMIHSRRSAERALGLTLLGAVFYMHFRISHVNGHHRRAATTEDPSSARLGESLYAFLGRSIAGQWREAWRFEAERLRRGGRRVRSSRNRMLAYLAVEGLFALAVGLASLRALAFVAGSAAVAILLLESFNYVAHYGLTRRLRPDGRPEPLGPQHSWNSARRMNNAALFNMGRHSDHHRAPMRAYQQLEAPPGAAELPAGYAGAMLMAPFPPLWRRVMDPRATRMAPGEALRSEPEPVSASR